MTESEATNALLEILGDRLPQPIMRAIEENDRGGGSTRLVLPRPDRRDELFIQVIFAPRGVVALLKLGVLPEQVIWGRNLGGNRFLARVRVDGAGEPEARFYDLRGTCAPFPRPESSGPYDFGDLPVTELRSVTWSSDDYGKAVRRKVAAAQRAAFGNNRKQADLLVSTREGLTDEHLPKGRDAMPLVKEMPGFEDWVELHKPGLTEERARSLGEMLACLEPGAELTRQATFEYCDLMLEMRRRLAERRRPTTAATQVRSAPVGPPRKNTTPTRGGPMTESESEPVLAAPGSRSSGKAIR